MTDGSRRRLVAWLLFTALLAWFLSLPLQDVFTFPDRLSVLPNLEADAAAYDAFARDFAATGQLSALPSKHPPGWMLLLAAVYASVGHSYVAGKLVSWFALVAATWLSAWIARRLYGTAAAVTAALLCASSPGLRAYVGTLQYEVVTGALFALFVVLSVRVLGAASARARLWRAATAGAAGAALVLTRETFVLTVMIVAVWMWRQSSTWGSGTRVRLLPIMIMLTAAAFPSLVWSAAQTLHYGRIILIAEKGPKEFQLGNHPLANGTYNEPLVGQGEPAGLAFIADQPGEAVRLAARKLLYLFGILRDGWTPPHAPAVWLWRASTGVVPLTFIEAAVRGGWLLVACLAALVMLRGDARRRWWFLPATVGAILAVHVVTLGSFRFAVPLLPVLYALAAGPVAAAVRACGLAVQSRAVAVPVAAVVALSVAAQFREWPLQVRYDAAELDGVSARNETSRATGDLVRAAEARHGVRPIVLLPDAYLPRGGVTVTVHARRTSHAIDLVQPAVRLALIPLRGTACVRDVLAQELRTEHFAQIVLPCRLLHDGPATLAVVSLGVADLEVREVVLMWRG
jgi:4-amino-4-deoxy-L-arabinose transferase-like glycosyltransferase